MINTYTGTAYANATVAQMLASFKQGLTYLSVHTSASVSYLTDTVEELDAIVSAGSGQYFRVQSAHSSYYDAQALSISRGIMSGGSFVAKASVGDDWLGGGNLFYPELIVINGGDMWDLGLHCSTVNYQYTYAKNFHLRSAEIKSSVDSTTYQSGDVFSVPVTSRPWPDTDYINIENDQVKIDYYHDQPFGTNVVPAGKVLLFPALLTASTVCPLGAATIGNKIVYGMYGSGMPLNAYTEFIVGQARFVSLGTVAIRSS